MGVHDQSFSELAEQMKAWRHDIHAHPETAFEEFRTAELIAGLLRDWGVSVETGLAGTGLVGTLVGASSRSGRSIGLRADMDALNMSEAGERPYRSRVPGKMHACGHDGHMAMLLGAARHLAATRDFDGTVHFIFQPAEELEGGGRVMVEEGLFDRFPCDSVWAIHNWPEHPFGTLAVRAGAVMAAADTFEIMIRGTGGHGALPHFAVDPVVVGAHLVTALQAIVSRSIDPLDSAVLSVTQLSSGSANNIIPETCRLSGTVRSFDEGVRQTIESRMRETAAGVASAFGAEATVDYCRGYPATVNSAQEAAIAAEVAEEVLGQDKIIRDFPPSTGSEDFAYMLQERPGAYLWLGQGTGPDSCMVHNPHFDFNDDLLPIGARLWVSLVQRLLPAAG